MSEILRNIADNWKLEAKLEDNAKYFFSSDEVDSIASSDKCFVVGRKGSGKSAICEHVVNVRRHDHFSEKMSFKNFPFNELYDLDNTRFTPPNQYITLWKFLIYSTVCKLMIKNEGINAAIRERLKEIYSPDPIKSLSRTITRWTSAEFGGQVLGTGGGFKLAKDTTNQSYTWIEKLNFLEDIITEHCDDSTYMVVFDELDEDYRDVIRNPESFTQYKYLLTSLFKAVQDVKYFFKDTGKNIKPVVFLRDDIYSIIQDADKNKWRDYIVEIEWTPKNLKDLLAFRISRDIPPGEDVLSFEAAWSKVFTHEHIKVGKKNNLHPFDYITRSTHLRPRDYIRYIQVCAAESVERENSIIGKGTIKFVDRAFSNYMRDEIIDEVTPVLPDIETIFQILSNIRKWLLTIKEFEAEYNKYLRDGTVSEKNFKYVLDILYNFSVLGNQHRSKQGVHYFKYQHTNMTLNMKELLVVHRGLFKAFQII